MLLFTNHVHGVELHNRSFGEFDDSAEIMRIQVRRYFEGMACNGSNLWNRAAGKGPGG